MLDVLIRDWIRGRSEISSRCKSIDLAGDNSTTKPGYPRLTVAQITDFREKDFDGPTNNKLPRVQLDIYSEKGQIGAEIADLLVGDDEPEGLLLTEFVGTAVGNRTVLDVDVDNMFRRANSIGPAVASAEGIDRITIEILIVLQ